MAAFFVWYYCILASSGNARTLSLSSVGSPKASLPEQFMFGHFTNDMTNQNMQFLNSGSIL